MWDLEEDKDKQKTGGSPILVCLCYVRLEEDIALSVRL